MQFILCFKLINVIFEQITALAIINNNIDP